LKPHRSRNDRKGRQGTMRINLDRKRPRLKRF
jgi:hypothetical protein